MLHRECKERKEDGPTWRMTNILETFWGNHQFNKMQQSVKLNAHQIVTCQVYIVLFPYKKVRSF